MTGSWRIRNGGIDDLPDLTGIYNHYVKNTHITFDVEAVSIDQRREWLTPFRSEGRHQLLVLEEEGRITGYAHSLPLKKKKAYETSVETTIYLKPGLGGKGRGEFLYRALLERLENEDVHRAYGLIALPNPQSIRLHEKLGFQQVAHLNEVGRKFSSFYDVIWVERNFG